MSYAQLKSFHAVAIEKTIQKACKRLHLTQPAVSIQIKTLEEETGKSLFRRNGHLLEVTADGALLFESTTRLFRAEEEANLILSSKSGYKGTLVLGADGPHVALDLVEKFRANHPDVKIEVVLANAEATWNNLLNLKVDAAVLAGSPDDDKVYKQTLVRQSLVALVPNNHALAKKTQLDLKELSEHPLIFREAGSSTQSKVEQAFQSIDLKVVPAVILGSREAVFEAVIRGIGIGFVFDREPGLDSRYKAIRISGFEDVNIDKLACLRDQMKNTFVSALFDCSTEIF